MSNKVQFIEQYKKLVQEIVQIRRSIPMTQFEVAEWLKVDRRKIIAIEDGEINISLLLDYADKLSIEIKLNYIIE